MQPLIVLCINIRSLMGKLGELVALVERLEVNLIFIQESWLDASVVNPVMYCQSEFETRSLIEEE